MKSRFLIGLVIILCIVISAVEFDIRSKDC